nr:hypothetical protein 6 [Gammaproteobacteria bacterium]
MNGWYRLWVLATIIIIAILTFDALDGQGITDSELKNLVVGSVVFSVGLLVFGHLVAWVIRGFKK